MLVWVRYERCQARPMQLLGWSLHVRVATMRLQPVYQQLYPPTRARSRCVERVALSTVGCIVSSQRIECNERSPQPPLARTATRVH